jgi:prepilin peptidase CpaA
MTIFAEVAPGTTFLVLLPFVATAVATDLARRQISNLLIVNMVGCGIVLQAVLLGASGVLSGLGGLAVGALVLLPFYALGGMGAGDVKLLAAAGSFLGPSSALLAGATTLGAGGVLALAAVAWRAASRLRISRSASVGSLDSAALREIQLPYSLAIAAGTLLTAYQGPGARLDGPILSGLTSW